MKNTDTVIVVSLFTQMSQSHYFVLIAHVERSPKKETRTSSPFLFVFGSKREARRDSGSLFRASVIEIGLEAQELSNTEFREDSNCSNNNDTAAKDRNCSVGSQQTKLLSEERQGQVPSNAMLALFLSESEKDFCRDFGSYEDYHEDF